MDKKVINGYSTDDAELTTASCWMDLLGFGSELDKLNWQLNKNNIKPIFDRLSRISQQFLKSFPHYEKIIMINDGMLRTLRNDYYNTNELITWVENCLRTHCICTGQEKDLHLPGMRTIICEGQSLTYGYRGIYYESEYYELNTALSKCYIADNAGSKAGLKKGSVYIEKTIIDKFTNELKCKKDDKYLILNQDIRRNEIKNKSLFESFFDPISLHKHKQLEEKMDSDRTSWIKFGETIIVEKNNLKIELIEVVLYSPFDESAFFYFDTFRGNMHGIVTDIIPLEFSFNSFWGKYKPQPDIKLRYANEKDIKIINNLLSHLDNMSKNQNKDYEK